MRERTQFIITLVLKREASAGRECQVKGEVFYFPLTKGHSRVYLNVYGHDLVGGRARVVPLMMFDWKRKEGKKEMWVGFAVCSVLNMY